MSNALAIAGITAVLQSLLDGLRSELSTALGTDVTITALAPENVPQSADDGPCLNIFLFQLNPSAAYRNGGLPSVDGMGSRNTRPPLALELRYLLTAYGSADLQAEVLLGYALQCLHEYPVLTRDTIRAVLAPAAPPATALQQALRKTGLAEQIELIKFSPAAMNLDELSKLWSALQASFRPSAAYECSVVLIDSQRAALAPLPVLSRGPIINRVDIDPLTLLPVPRRIETGVVVQAGLSPPYPALSEINTASGQPAAQLGEVITLAGTRLAGVAGQYRLLLDNQRLGLALNFGPELNASDSAVQFTLPATASALPPGVYAARLQLQIAGEAQPRISTPQILIVAPQFAANPLPASVVPDAQGRFSLTPNCLSQFLPQQTVSLLLGSHDVVATPFNAPTSTPSFSYHDIPPGLYRLRLRVDGVDSLLVDHTQDPPAYIGPQIQVL